MSAFVGEKTKKVVVGGGYFTIRPLYGLIKWKLGEDYYWYLNETINKL